MQDDIIRVLKPFQQILYSKFRQNKHEAIEILLMLAFGHIFEIFTPNQMAEIMGIDKNQIYGSINSWSIYLLRRMFLIAGCQEAVKVVKERLAMSPATLSRARITMSVDDTVIDRLGRVIRLTYSWYSGKHKKVVRGQNIIAITIKVDDRIIPLCIRPVGKQGRANTTKPEIFREMLYQVLEFFRQEGIDLTQFPITFDSSYGSSELAEMLEEAGFDQILVHTRGNYVFSIDGERKKLRLHKEEIQLQDDLWGCKDIPVARRAAESPTFGKVILLFFEYCSVIKCVMAFGRKLRACEILSIWKQHHSIEQFWRRLKNELQIHRMRPRSREGINSMIAIKLLAYLVMEKLSALIGLTFRQIMNYVKRNLDLSAFFHEHFHLSTVHQRL
jgi:hypothetical protein